MDYRELLKKYISHIIDCEGVSFIENYHPSFPNTQITEEEWEELIKLEEEVDDGS